MGQIGKPNSFDVMKEMAKRNGKIMLCPLSNITNARYSAKRQGTDITIGAPGNVCSPIIAGEYVGGLILADKTEFDAISKELAGTGD